VEWGGYKKRVLEGEYGRNIMYLYENEKNDTCSTVPGIGREGIRENDGGSEFNYDTL
jgi:hypothetical protein